ncbi:hypothetical protein F2Q69_00023002 [Brassica cretica]|uniref:Uncharacterized protein n=1 Tax=Brassica cretica TaxID=69181 RepID=A0A8S9QLP9_BRACR|nr:hypothetical protein F2Q69_00023002 [Brassica cretica]
MYVLGRYVATESCACSVATDRASGRARSLRSERAVYVLSCYKATEFRGELGRYVATELWGELGRYVATEPSTELRGELGRYVATELQGELSCYVPIEPWQDLGLLLVLGGLMTNSTYVSRYSFDQIPYRFKVRDRFSAYITCLVGIEHLSGDNLEVLTKISGFFYSALLSLCRMFGDHFFERKMVEMRLFKCRKF